MLFCWKAPEMVCGLKTSPDFYIYIFYIGVREDDDRIKFFAGTYPLSS